MEADNQSIIMGWFRGTRGLGEILIFIPFFAHPATMLPQIKKY